MKSAGPTYTPNDLLCGMDGGGTTTQVVVCNREGVVLHTWQTGTLNHYGAGMVTVQRNFQAIASHLAAHFGCLPQHVFVGNSALSNRASPAVVADLTGGAFRGARVAFHSDVYIALLGFTAGNPGAVLIAGTGSMACGLDPQGRYHTLGGWGQVLGDEGSAYYIALEGMRAALQAHDGLSEATQLTGRLMRFFHLREVGDIVARVYDPPLEKSAMAAFAPEVEEAAGEGDRTAQEILDRAGAWLHRLAVAICTRCQTKNLGYTGSVLVRNATVREALCRRLSAQAITLEVPRLRPEMGALIAAFAEAQLPVTDKVKQNFLAYQQAQSA